MANNIVVSLAWMSRSPPAREHPPLCFVAFFRPGWESTAAALTVTAAAMAMVYRAEPGWSPLERSLPAVMANLLAVAAVLGARITIDRAVRAVEWDDEMERQAESTRAQLAIGVK